MSNNSLMSVDDTPGKSSPYGSRGPTPMSIDSSRKRLVSSRSMLNLQTGSKPVTAKQLFPSQSKDCLRSAAKTQSEALLNSPSRRAQVAEESFFGQRASSPAKRTAQAAFAAQQQEIPASPSRSSRPTQPSRTSTAPPILATLPPAPKWNMDDEDNLPSPFIKKKAETRQQKNARAPPAVPSRQLRPSTSKLSLATKLAMGRGKAAAEEQHPQQQTRSSDRRTSVAAQ